ncbi:MAG: DUF1801 domain-containing protein [Methanoregula sp.]
MTSTSRRSREKERTVLDELRRAVKAAAPDAEERIRYGIPVFTYHGPLVSFAAFAKPPAFFRR